MNYFNKLRNHLKTIRKHRKYVRQYCFAAGLHWQGIVHDLSKYSPIEFFESARYYTGSISPINVCKAEVGYSLGWFHHRGRNKHHWEYWVDNFEKGMTAALMPYKYALEMVCDFLGAGKAYQKEHFSYEQEYGWWCEKRKVAIIHPAITMFVEGILSQCYASGDAEDILRHDKFLKAFYKICISRYPEKTYKTFDIL